MGWLASIVIALLSGIFALFGAGTVASLVVDWYNISSFEGGSGYFVIGMALLGLLAGLVLGLVIARVVAARPKPSFLKGLGTSCGAIALILAVIAGGSRLLADVPPENRWRDALPSGRAALAAGRPSGARLFAGRRIPPAGCVERLSREEAGGRPPVHRRRGPRRRPMDRPRVRLDTSPAVASACWRPALATRTWAPSSFRFLLIPGPPNSNGATGSRMRPAGSRRSRIRSPTDSASRGRVSRFARFASAGSRSRQSSAASAVPPTPRASAPRQGSGSCIAGSPWMAAERPRPSRSSAANVPRSSSNASRMASPTDARSSPTAPNAPRSRQSVPARCRWNCSR